MTTPLGQAVAFAPGGPPYCRELVELVTRLYRGPVTDHVRDPYPFYCEFTMRRLGIDLGELDTIVRLVVLSRMELGQPIGRVRPDFRPKSYGADALKSRLSDWLSGQVRLAARVGVYRQLDGLVENLRGLADWAVRPGWANTLRAWPAGGG